MRDDLLFGSRDIVGEPELPHKELKVLLSDIVNRELSPCRALTFVSDRKPRVGPGTETE